MSNVGVSRPEIHHQLAIVDHNDGGAELLALLEAHSKRTTDVGKSLVADPFNFFRHHTPSDPHP